MNLSQNCDFLSHDLTFISLFHNYLFYFLVRGENRHPQIQSSEALKTLNVE